MFPWDDGDIRGKADRVNTGTREPAPEVVATGGRAIEWARLPVNDGRRRSWLVVVPIAEH